MPRTDDLKSGVPVWASSAGADKNLDVRTGEPALTAANGYEEIYSARDGSKPTRRQFNQMFYWLTKHIDEANKHGMFEWDSAVAYEHPAAVIGSDARIYISVQGSTNEDPVSDSSSTYWRPVAPTSRLLPENNGPANSYLNGNKAWGSLATDAASALQGRLLPASNGSANTFLAHDKVFRDPATTLGARGRLLPVSNGSPGQVLLHDKTFGAVPGGHTREELWFGTLRFDRIYDMSTGTVRYRPLGSEYDVTDWDWIEIYIRQTSDGLAISGSQRVSHAAASAPLNIPQNHLTNDEGVSTPTQGSATPNGMWAAFYDLLGSFDASTNSLDMYMWRNDDGLLVAWDQSPSVNPSSYHFSIYGTRY